MVRATLKLAAVAVAMVALLGGSTALAAGQASLAGTAWKTTMKKGGEVTGTLFMAFNEDEEFLLLVADTDGDIVKKVKGTYTFRNGMLVLSVDGQPFAREEVTELTRSA